MNRLLPRNSSSIIQKSANSILGISSLHSNPSILSFNNIKLKSPTLSTFEQTCLLEFDGASKGNPGPAGAGAVLRTLNGTVICKVHQGLGLATNNVAEYRAVILGLKIALAIGYTSIRAQGDSKLVCMQLQGLWKVKNPKMADLHAEATKLKNKFASFQIHHVLRKLNSEADAQANMGVSLADGQALEQFETLQP